MKKPTQTESFMAAYAIASRGCERELFGKSFKDALPAFKRSLIGVGYPHAYLEFPLLGEPGFDLLTVHTKVEPGARFAPGAGYGYQPMFDWYTTVCGERSLSCGIELDISAGETQRAGVYLQQRKHTELVEPFLASVGESSRAAGYLEMLERMPEGWPPAYVGLFPARPGTPLRIGGYMGYDQCEHYVQDPEALGKAFDRIGFTAYDHAMLTRCATFMSYAPSIDFQFDIMEDGSLGDTFGLSLSFNETKPRQAQECMSSGYGAELMGALQAWGLADDRWKLIADTAFARHVPFEREDGSEGRFALCALFNYAKVKFRAGEAQPAKFYLILQANELQL